MKIRATEQELRDFAEAQAETIVIRTYVNGNSSDDRRKTTKPEKEIIKAVIFGGLLAINRGGSEESIVDACEFIADIQLPEMNGYDTIYLPIKKWCRDTAEAAS